MSEISRRRLHAHLDALSSGLLERETPVRLVLLAALAGEHVLLIGPPGTAKSALARRLHGAFTGLLYFERLLTRFSTPEELFGPLSLKALEDDRYERLTAGFLPRAGIAFLDEVFKANSAILNTLLTLLNEREFDNGSARLATPLVSVIGASNELPADDGLLAFFDRFLVRVPVAPVGDAAFAALLHLAPVAAPPLPPRPITAAERHALVQAAEQVTLSVGAVAACTALRRHLTEGGQTISDRRWRQWVGLMRVAAASEGRAMVDALDLWLAPYIAATRPEDVDSLSRWFEAELLRAVPQPATWLTHAVQAFEQQLQIEADADAETDAMQAADEGAGKLALARALAGHGGNGDTAMPRLHRETPESLHRRRYSPVHVAARLAQLDELIGSAQDEARALEATATELAAALAGRLWMPPALVQRLNGAHRQTLATLGSLLDRAAACRSGFAALPMDAGLSAAAPPAVELALRPR